MKQVVRSNQEIFNSLLNFKKFIVYLPFFKKYNFDILKEEMFSEKAGVFDNPKQVAGFVKDYTLIVYLNRLNSGFEEFYTNIITSYPQYLHISSRIFELYADFGMIKLLNKGGIDISKTDVFKNDESIYSKCYSMKNLDYKKYLKKWDSLDPVDLIVKYYPRDNVFDVKMDKNDYQVTIKKINNENVKVKTFIDFNNNAYKSFYDFYKFAGFYSRTIDKYKLRSVVRASQTEQELRKNLFDFNDFLVEKNNYPLSFNFKNSNKEKEIIIHEELKQKLLKNTYSMR